MNFLKPIFKNKVLHIIILLIVLFSAFLIASFMSSCIGACPADTNMDVVYWVSFLAVFIPYLIILMIYLAVKYYKK